jgi:hypothetical protein
VACREVGGARTGISLDAVPALIHLPSRSVARTERSVSRCCALAGFYRSLRSMGSALGPSVQPIV